MPRRAAMWPSELTFDPAFVNLTPLSQWLFKFLWLHPDLDSGGYLPLQVEIWAKASAYLTPQEVEGALDELIAQDWVSVDDQTGELWVKPFIDLDSSKKPNIFIAAMRCAETRRSTTLRREAWQVINSIYQQHPIKPPGDDADEKAWKAHRTAVDARDDAYEQLRSRMVREGFGRGSGTVVEPPSVSVPVLENSYTPTQLCNNGCPHPPVQRGLCAACLGREL